MPLFSWPGFNCFRVIASTLIKYLQLQDYGLSSKNDKNDPCGNFLFDPVITLDYSNDISVFWSLKWAHRADWVW